MTPDPEDTNPIDYASPAADPDVDPAGKEDEEGDDDVTDDEAEADGDEVQVEVESLEDIERLVVDPDDIVESMRFNGNEDDISKGKAVLRLTPPFGETVEPEVHHLESEELAAEDMDEEALVYDYESATFNLRPLRFVEDGRAVLDQRPTPVLAEEELDVEEPTDEEVAAWVDAALETWESHIRDNLKSYVDLTHSHGIVFVDVEYDPEP